VLATSFGVFALLPAALLLPAFQILQLYADLPYCPDDRALRRHIHLIPPHYIYRLRSHLLSLPPLTRLFAALLLHRNLR
jgi:hypothetical protein